MKAWGGVEAAEEGEKGDELGYICNTVNIQIKQANKQTKNAGSMEFSRCLSEN